MARILAVDDSASMRQMVSFTLKGAGHEVVEAVDGVDALSKAKGTTFDLVISDVNMPNMDGITLIKELRALPAFKFKACDCFLILEVIFDLASVFFSTCSVIFFAVFFIHDLQTDT